MHEAGLSCTEENCTNPEHLHIGDYVNYQNPTKVSITGEGYTETGYISPAAQTGMKASRGGSDINQTYEIGENQLHWRVLGKDETTGGIKLIAGSPMKRKANSALDELSGITNDPYFYMYGAKAYVNGITELNKICAIYKNDLASEARSVNIGDVNAITGITTEEKIKEVNVGPSQGYEQYGETYKIENQWTPENYLIKGERGTINDTTDGYYYGINVPSEAGIPSATVASTKQYNLLLQNIEYGKGRAYWLASRGVLAYSGYPNFDSMPTNKGSAITRAVPDMGRCFFWSRSCV